MREYRYTVDADGRIFHEGSEIVDPAVLRFFLRTLSRAPGDRLVVLCQGEQNWFEAADTPFVVQRLRCRTDGDALVGVELVFAGDYGEPLDASTLETEGGHLYCRVRRGAFRARFGRIALQQLAAFLVESDTHVALELGGITHAIRPTDTRGR
jgi:hypothetical protein